MGLPSLYKYPYSEHISKYLHKKKAASKNITFLLAAFIEKILDPKPEY